LDDLLSADGTIHIDELAFCWNGKLASIYLRAFLYQWLHKEPLIDVYYVTVLIVAVQEK